MANISGNYGYNIGAFVFLVVAYYMKNQSEPLFVAFCLMSLSILLDIIVMGVYGKELAKPPKGTKDKYADTTRFCFG